VKQAELQPWDAKINKTSTDVNVARGELETLEKKAEAAKAASIEAQEHLEKLQASHESKVSVLRCVHFTSLTVHSISSLTSAIARQRKVRFKKTFAQVRNDFR
jgi:hypothetical protein